MMNDNDPSMPEMSDEDQARQGEQHFNTLMDAHKVMNDPMKMKMAMMHSAKVKKGIRSIEDLKTAGKNLASKPMGDGGKNMPSGPANSQDADGAGSVEE